MFYEDNSSKYRRFTKNTNRRSDKSYALGADYTYPRNKKKKPRKCLLLIVRHSCRITRFFLARGGKNKELFCCRPERTRLRTFFYNIRRTGVLAIRLRTFRQSARPIPGRISQDLIGISCDTSERVWVVFRTDKSRALSTTLPFTPNTKRNPSET